MALPKKCIDCFRLAGDPNRHRILSTLRGGPMSVTEITEKLGLSQPTVTYHLKLLAAANLVTLERRGRFHYFSLNLKSHCFTGCGALSGLPNG